MWAHMMAQFEAHAHQIIRFARAIPGFRDLPRADTKLLVQASMYPIVLIQLSREPLPGGDFNFYNFSPRERRHLLVEFPQINPLVDHFYELTGFLGPLNLDNTEAALLCSIIFLRGCMCFSTDTFLLNVENKKETGSLRISHKAEGFNLRVIHKIYERDTIPKAAYCGHMPGMVRVIL